MSYTNETTFYGLPLPTGSDKSTFTDNNTAFQAVDAALHTAYEQSGAATEDIVAIKATVANLIQADIDFQNDLDTEKGKIRNLQDKEVLQDAEIAAVKADAFDMITAYNEPTATSTHAYSVGDYFIYNDVLYRATSAIEIGDTIVPDTNCVTTNVSTELVQIKSDVSDKINEATTLASGTANQTYAQQLTALQTTFSALNVDRKRKCFILDGDDVIPICSRNGKFTITTVTNDTVYMLTLDITNATAYRCQLSAGGAVFVDRSSATDTHQLHLMCSL